MCVCCLGAGGGQQGVTGLRSGALASKEAGVPVRGLLTNSGSRMSQDSFSQRGQEL